MASKCTHGMVNAKSKELAIKKGLAFHHTEGVVSHMVWIGSSMKVDHNQNLSHYG